MKKIILGIVVVTITACSTTKMTGTSMANDLLQKDTMKILLPYAQAKLGCSAIGSVYASPMTVSSKGVVTERWKIAGCDNEFAVQVTFTPDATGGVGINIKVDE